MQRFKNIYCDPEIKSPPVCAFYKPGETLVGANGRRCFWHDKVRNSPTLSGQGRAGTPDGNFVVIRTTILMLMAKQYNSGYGFLYPGFIC
jgi:hypothetical protein